ncbi:MAG: glycosyltransferase [Pseudomonadota bacterium]
MSLFRSEKSMNHKGSYTFFVTNMGGGGTERTISNLLRGFSSDECAVDLVLLQATGPYLDDLPPNVSVFTLNRRSRLFALLPLVKYFRKRRPSFFISFFTRNNLLAIVARRIARVPSRLIVNERQNLKGWLAQEPFWRRLHYRLLIRLLYPRADRLFTNSRGVAEDLARFLPELSSKIRFVPNGVLTPDFQEKTAEPIPRSDLFRNDRPVILAVGRLYGIKDFPTMIHAFARIRREQTATLVILGDGPRRRELEELVRNLRLENDVCFLGFVRNPFNYMARARLVVISSLIEASPNVLIEALACGTPVVSTDCDYGPRELLKDRRFGTLVPVRDHRTLAQAILERLRAAPERVDAGDALRCYGFEEATKRFREALLEA